MRAVATAAGKGLASAGVLLGGAALAAVLLRPAGERGLIESGVVYTIITYDLVLPLVGLGVALTSLTRRQTIACAIVLMYGVFIGVVGEHRLLATAALPPELARPFTYLGPLCCLAAGLALAPAGRLRRWLAPAATGLSGAALGFLAALHDPTVGDPRFAGGAAATGLWLVATPPAVLRWFDGPWLTIGGRILASWLVAIGLLLGASKLVLQRRADQAQAASQLSVQPPASLDPGDATAPPGFKQPREWGDDSRQP